MHSVKQLSSINLLDCGLRWQQVAQSFKLDMHVRRLALAVSDIFIWRVLTYMATLEHLADSDKVIRHEPDLEDDEFAERYAYFAPAFDVSLSALRAIGCLHGRKLTPYEQTERILYDYVIGVRLAYGSDYHPLDPLGFHTWELKTPDVRLFGWFPRRRHFIIVCWRLKDDLKPAAKYASPIQEVVDFRNLLDLDEPKAVTGVRADEVL